MKKYPDRFGDDVVYQEAKLSTEDRESLNTFDFGIPEKREYPMPDKDHVMKAVQMFSHADESDKEELAQNIISKAKKFGMDYSGWISLKDYVPDVEFVQEALFDHAFNTMRAKLAAALGDKFKVTNVMKAMGHNNDKFIVTPVDDDSKKVHVLNVGNAVKVPGYFSSIALSRAFDKLVELFTSPEFVNEYDTHMEDVDVDDTSMDDYDDNDNEFGSDTSSYQSEDFTDEDIVGLNKLIADEQEAIKGYFDEAKKTKVDILARLYSDIGDEERFHTEQLLYAKATLMGEKYEPSDPDVRKEYEELLAMGMDEETAVTTAIDKQRLIGTDDEDDDDISELELDVDVLESALTMLSNNIDRLEVICEHVDDYTDDEFNDQLEMFAESFCMEAVDNVNDPKSSSGSMNIKPKKSPILTIFGGFQTLIKFIKQLVARISTFIKRVSIKQKRMHNWIKTHGVKELFARGVSLYFYSDKEHGIVMIEPLQYTELMHNVTRDIGKTVGFGNIGSFTDAAGKHGRIKWDPIRYNGIDNGLEKIKGVVLSKSKVVITPENEQQLAYMFFGYTQGKTDRGQSFNVYNMLEDMAYYVNKCADVDNMLIEKLKAFESQPNSIFYTKRDVYDKAIKDMGVVTNGFKTFIKALAHDMNVILKLNNGLLEQTKQSDYNDNPNKQ